MARNSRPSLNVAVMQIKKAGDKIMELLNLMVVMVYCTSCTREQGAAKSSWVK